MDKKVELKNIIKSCEKRFNRGTSDTWKHSDFNDFSREIQQETKVNISYSTLKRIFGKISVDDYYLPQQATIEALKKYCEYIAQNTAEEIPVNTSAINSENRSKPVKKNIFWSLLLLVFFMGGGYYYYKNDKNSGSVIVSSTEGNLPTTAFFNLKIPKSKDSIFIDFGDKSTLIYLEPNQQKASHTYFFPGVFKVNIKSRNSIIAETQVYISSNRWFGMGYHLQKDIPDSYYALTAIKKGKDSLFHITNKELQRTGIDTLNLYYTRLCNYTLQKNCSDNFIFETIFKKEEQLKKVYCNSVQFEITGTNNRIRFNFVNPGCSSRVTNVISEKIYKGNMYKLSQFTLDLSQWNTIKLINRDKNLSLFINEKLLFSTSYKQSIGNIRGVFVEFKGNGYVKNCSLKSLDDKNIYYFN